MKILKLALLGAGLLISGSVSATVNPDYAAGFKTTLRRPAVPYDKYQGPDGRYDSQSDFIRSLNGTPCGLDCAKRARLHWGLAN